MQKKLLSLKVTDEDRREVEAVFATFDVIDADGDITRKGAFTEGAEVAISAWNHRSWKEAPPVGVGTIHETDDGAVLKGRFFDTADGRDHFTIVKERGAKQEWSYSLHNVKSAPVKVDGRTANEIRSVDVDEVSPVMKGAGVNTRTLSTKALKQFTNDLRMRLQEAGEERFCGDRTYCYVQDFDVDDQLAVFQVWSYADGDRTVRLVQVGFTRSDTSVELAEDETEVERFTAYRAKAADTPAVTKSDEQAGSDTNPTPDSTGLLALTETLQSLHVSPTVNPQP